MKKLIKQYNDNGFIVLKKLLSKKEVQFFEIETKRISNILIEKYNRPYVNLTKDKKINTAHNLNKIFPNSILSKTIIKKKTIQSFLKKIFKDKPALRNLEMFMKPPKTGLAAPWHQDNYYWNVTDSRAVNIWIALDSVSNKNGGLIYLKGSHELGTLKHTPSGAKGSSQEIKKNIISKLNYKKICPKLNVGDCLIHHSEVIHGSKKNISELSRRGIVISFKAKSSKYDYNKLKNYKSNLREQLK